jgi:hypothetical protein
MKMKQINVVRKFNLHHPMGVQKHFGIGVHEVEDEIANHPQVKAHTKPFVDRKFNMPSPLIPIDPADTEKSPDASTTFNGALPPEDDEIEVESEDEDDALEPETTRKRMKKKPR